MSLLTIFYQTLLFRNEMNSLHKQKGVSTFGAH